jgi:epoxyqueuosine reductase QueG
VKKKTVKKSAFEREAEKIAREWLKARGKRPTKEQVEKAARHPRVTAEVERRAAATAAAVGNKNSK